MRDLSASRKIYAFGSIILGILLLVWPHNALRLAAYAVGIIIMSGGITAILAHFRSRYRSLFSTMNLISAVLITIAGIWIFMNPTEFVSIIPTVFGYIILLSGVINLLETFALTRVRYNRWWASLLSAIVTIVMGLFLVNHAIGVASIMVRLVGLFLLFNGISNLLIARKVDQYVFYGNMKNMSSGSGRPRAGGRTGAGSTRYDTSDPDIIDAEDYREVE